MGNNLLYRPGFLGFDVFNELFSGAHYDLNSALTKTTQGYPVTDIYESSDGSTVMEFALAGFKKEDLKIDVQPEKRTVTVSATATSGGDDNRKIARRSFTKTYVNYDNSLDFSTVTAKFENGLLTVKMPRRQEEKPKSVEIS